MITCAPRAVDEIVAHARRDAPRECCGLLLGSGERIDTAHPVANRADDPLRRYDIDPRDFLAAVKQCRGTARSVIGAYHSHPRSPAQPSETDRVEAVDGFLYLIAGPVQDHQTVPLEAYRFEAGNFHRLRIVLDAKEPQT